MSRKSGNKSFVCMAPENAFSSPVAAPARRRLHMKSVLFPLIAGNHAQTDFKCAEKAFSGAIFFWKSVLYTVSV